MTSPFDMGVPLTENPAERIFDTNAFGARASTYRFDLVDVDGVYDPDPLTPLRGTAPTLSHDTGRTVKRTLSLALGVGDSRRFDPVRHRVEPVMLIGDAEYPLGRFMAVDDTMAESRGGDQSSAMFTDESTQLVQQLTRSFSAVHDTDSDASVTIGVNIRRVFLDFLARYEIFDPRVGQGGRNTMGTFQPVHGGGSLTVEADIEGTPYATSNSWQAGASGGQVIEDLALSGDYFSPWMGNDRGFHMIRTFDPADRVPLVDWDSSASVIRGSVTRSNDLLTASNRFVVIGNQGGGDNAAQPIVGRYDVPASAPWSIRNRGFVVPSVVDMQLQSAPQATAVARALGIRQTVYERVTASTPPDPRHDSYDVVIWRGERWLELAWSLTLVEGAPMQHSLRKVFEDA